MIPSLRHSVYVRNPSLSLPLYEKLPQPSFFFIRMNSSFPQKVALDVLTFIIRGENSKARANSSRTSHRYFVSVTPGINDSVERSPFSAMCTRRAFMCIHAVVYER